MLRFCLKLSSHLQVENENRCGKSSSAKIQIKITNKDLSIQCLEEALHYTSITLFKRTMLLILLLTIIILGTDATGES